MSAWTDAVLPHGPLVPLASGLWQVTGALPRGPLPRNMVVYRLADGGLWIHSAVALDETGMAALEALGPVKVLVVPNPWHRHDAARFAARYPEARVVCPAAARAKVAQRVRVDAAAEDALTGGGVKVHAPPGVKPHERVYELVLEGGGRALVFTDLLFNLPHQPGVGGFVLRLVGSSGFFGVTRIGRLAGVTDRAALAGWLEQVAAWPDLRVLCVAHGDAVTEACGARLQAAARRLR